ncbi:MAG: membrane dipeptidase, partial [Caldilinea sp.]
AWNNRNAACDGVAESRTNGGLTEFGVKVVAECNRLGIILDVSHLAPAGVTDVLAVSGQPIIASHSNARALCDHPRNLTAAQLEAIASKGGVIGVTFVDAFLNRGDPQAATLDDVVANIEYMLGVVGPDHVALGSDFDGWTLPKELKDATCYPLITQKLVERGHHPGVIRKILGENLLRVMRTVLG